MEPHLFDRISVLYKYRWASITVFLLVVGWVMVDSYTQVPRYQATARILIEEPGNDIATPSEIARTAPVSDPEIYMQTQLRIMRGRDLALRVSQKIDLARVPEFNGQGPQPTPLAKSIAAVKYYAMWPYRLVTSAQAPPMAPPGSGGNGGGDYADALLSRFQVEEVRGSQLVDTSFESSDPEFAARAANAFADEYVSYNLTLKIQSLEKSAEWLSGEVERQAKLVQESELKLAQYREKQDAGALDSGQNIVVARLNSLNEQLTLARTDRIRKESVWKQLQAAGQNVDSMSAVLNSTNVQNFRARITELQQEAARVAERYGEKHPERQRVATALASAERNLQDEINKAVQNARNDYEAAVTQERVLLDSLNESKRAATDLSRKGVDYSALQREADSNRAVYPTVDARKRTARGGQQPHQQRAHGRSRGGAGRAVHAQSPP